MLSYMLNNSWSLKYDYLICCFISLLFVEVEPTNDDIYTAPSSVYVNNQVLGTSKHESIYTFVSTVYLVKFSIPLLIFVWYFYMLTNDFDSTFCTINKFFTRNDNVDRR